MWLAASAAWAAQLFGNRAFAWSGGKNIYQLASDGGQFEAIAMFGTPGRGGTWTQRRVNVAFIPDYPETLVNRWGFALAVRTRRGGGSDYIALPMIAARVPCWFVVAGLAGAFVACRRWRRERSASAANLCPACGYDLRATPDRCPECGHDVHPAAGSRTSG